jgi:hypothetical protein
VQTDSVNAIEQIKTWFDLTSPSPTSHQSHAQIASHLDGVSEMLTALQGVGRSFEIREQVRFSADVLTFIQRQIKAERHGAELVLPDLNTADVLKNLCDQIIAIVGIAHVMRLDIAGALHEVMRSNESNLDENGEAIFNEQLRLVKGPRYSAPDLTSFI